MQTSHFADTYHVTTGCCCGPRSSAFFSASIYSLITVYLLLAHYLRFAPFSRDKRTCHVHLHSLRTANKPTFVLPKSGVFIKVYTTFAGCRLTSLRRHVFAAVSENTRLRIVCIAHTNLGTFRFLPPFPLIKGPISNNEFLLMYSFLVSGS